MLINTAELVHTLNITQISTLNTHLSEVNKFQCSKLHKKYIVCMYVNDGSQCPPAPPWKEGPPPSTRFLSRDWLGSGGVINTRPVEPFDSVPVTKG